MSEEAELPKVCPACGSYEYHVRNNVEMIVTQQWGAHGDNRKHLAMWPCMDNWHTEGSRREWEKLPEEEKCRIDAEIEAMLSWRPPPTQPK